MDKIRVLSNDERKYILQRLQEIESRVKFIKDLIDPIEAGLDETPPVPKEDIRKCRCDICYDIPKPPPPPPKR